MIHPNKKVRNLIIVIPIALSSLISEAKSAEKVTFVNGIFSRTVTVENIESFTKSEGNYPLLEEISKLDTEKPNKIKSLLAQEFELNIILTSRLMNSKIGEIIIKRIARIIYPLKLKQETKSVPAIKTGIIKGLDT